VTQTPAALQPVQQAALEKAVLDAFAPASRHDPYPAYEVLRAAGPFVPGPLDTQLVTRYADCEAILADPVWSHAEERDLLHPASEVELPGSFLWMEPPDHTRLRRLVGAAFTPRRIEAMRTHAERVAAGLVGSALAAGEVDLIESLAYPLPLTMVCELLGVPREAHADVRRMSAGIARGLDPDALLSAAELGDRTQAVHDFAAFFGDLVAQRREHPRDDLITALAQVEADGDVLSTQEMLGTLLILVVAGHETTVNLIGNGVLALLRHPDQLARLRATDDPDLDRSTVEELMRFDGPIQMVERITLEPVVIGGREIPARRIVVCLTAAANRDPYAFPNPDRLDLGRTPNPHVGFGGGAHFCLGAALARLEGRIAIATLARRFPQLRLLDPKPEWRPSFTIRGLKALPLGL
jgi:cytochrome P450